MTYITKQKRLRTLAGDEHRSFEERECDCGVREPFLTYRREPIAMRTWRKDRCPFIVGTPYWAKNPPYKRPDWRLRLLRMEMTKDLILFKRNKFLIADNGAYMLKYEEE